MPEENYISRQIAVYKTNIKLIEFIDKLNMATYQNYANIHANGNKDIDGKKIYSNIGIIMQDYSQGTGDKLIRVKANISPSEAQYIFANINQKTFDFSTDKIFGNPDVEGYSIVNKMRIVRAEASKNGEVRKYPWYIEIENGKGIKSQSKNGGIYRKSGTYILQNKIFININDLDFFILLNRVNQFIINWEALVAPKLISIARQAIKTNMQDFQNK